MTQVEAIAGLQVACTIGTKVMAGVESRCKKLGRCAPRLANEAFIDAQHWRVFTGHQGEAWSVVFEVKALTNADRG